jgi:glycosyltransferase involved in cell wall biosynthesis
MPIRNVESTLREAMDSINAQSFRDFELVVVNDHCKDQSESIFKDFPDPRFRIIQNPGMGLVDALNYGVANCRTGWIVRMDGDDIMHAKRLEHLWNVVSHSPELDLVANRVELVSLKPLSDGYVEYMRWQNNVLTQREIDLNIYVESPFSHPGVMFKKSTFNLLGGYREGDFPEDYELWLRMHQHGARMVKIPKNLLFWRDSPQRLSRNHSSYRRSAFDNLRARFLARDRRLRHGRPLVFWGAGRKTRKRSQLLMDKGFQPGAWVDIDPKKIGNRINNVKVEEPCWLQQQDPRPFVLIYVTNHGAREQISTMLEEFGYEAGKDYLAVG